MIEHREPYASDDLIACEECDAGRHIADLERELADARGQLRAADIIGEHAQKLDDDRQALKQKLREAERLLYIYRDDCHICGVESCRHAGADHEFANTEKVLTEEREKREALEEWANEHLRSLGYMNDADYRQEVLSGGDIHDRLRLAAEQTKNQLIDGGDAVARMADLERENAAAVAEVELLPDLVRYVQTLRPRDSEPRLVLKWWRDHIANGTRPVKTEASHG